MADPNSSPDTGRRWVLAAVILGISAAILIALGVFAIITDQKNAMTIFNMTLPVAASWVGTVLAFYFGRANFESANQQVRATTQQVRDMVERLSPEQRAQKSLASIMRPIADMTYFSIPDGQGDADVKLSDLKAKFGPNCQRLPILDAKGNPKYMIHQSSLNQYLLTGRPLDDSLAKLIAGQSASGAGFGLGKGFVVVSSQTVIGEAKRKMEATPGCEDIFVTKDGSADQPLLGWVSNVRLGKYLQA